MTRFDEQFGLAQRGLSGPSVSPASFFGPSATLRRTTPRPGRGQVTSYGEDRVCATAECATKLSRYNSTLHCVVHQERHR